MMNYQDLYGPEPLKDCEIQGIPKIKITPEQLVEGPLQCSVCLEYLQVDEEAKKLRCNHHFHERCIVPWLKRRGTCPDCRSDQVPWNRRTFYLGIPRTLRTRGIYNLQFEGSPEDGDEEDGPQPLNMEEDDEPVEMEEDDEPLDFEEGEDALCGCGSSVIPSYVSLVNYDAFSLDVNISSVASPTSLSEDAGIRFSFALDGQWGDSSPEAASASLVVAMDTERDTTDDDTSDDDTTDDDVVSTPSIPSVSSFQSVPFVTSVHTFIENDDDDVESHPPHFVSSVSPYDEMLTESDTSVHDDD
ncbi:hypothetical protein GE061_012096 [Apolygus lucorum]|uniref:RING-type domain-containing protein n=1 Tax=Apolygus lucorum TaxID=248454 RepID=A0A6A4JDV8_APOLU|nr:hypothetical protein GE061_012096 [Apolygus lucorum]